MKKVFLTLCLFAIPCIAKAENIPVTANDMAKAICQHFGYEDAAAQYQDYVGHLPTTYSDPLKSFQGTEFITRKTAETIFSQNFNQEEFGKIFQDLQADALINTEQLSQLLKFVFSEPTDKKEDGEVLGYQRNSAHQFSEKLKGQEAVVYQKDISGE